MIKLKTLLRERYGGSEKERGIWYHGTSMKRIPQILASGLVNLPLDKKSWNSDPYTSSQSFDRTSYGGTYVTQNLMSAIGAGGRTARNEKSSTAIISLSLQPRSLIGDEDSIASIFTNTGIMNSIHDYMCEVYDIPDKYKKSAIKEKEIWCDTALSRLFNGLEINDDRFKNRVRQLLFDEGYKAMLIRTISYIDRSLTSSEYLVYGETYLIYNDIKITADNLEKVPPPPIPSKGEHILRSFIDKLTKTMKHIARHSFTDSFSKTARILEPIGFSGSNRIIGIAEKQDYNIKIIYGKLPEDFLKQWSERMPKNYKIINPSS